MALGTARSWCAFANPIVLGALRALSPGSTGARELAAELERGLLENDDRQLADLFRAGTGLPAPRSAPASVDLEELSARARGACGRLEARDRDELERLLESSALAPGGADRLARMRDVSLGIVQRLLRNQEVFSYVARLASGRRETGTLVIAPGTVFAGRYAIKERLGEGGFGTVWRVEHLDLHEDFALKQLKPGVCSDEEGERRFLREIAATKAFVHKGAVQLRDFGRDPVTHRLYYVMDLVPGRTLRAVLDHEHRLPVARALDVALQILDVLVEAHGAGIVHRDLKPANVMLTKGRRHAEEVRLLDFGLARAVRPDDAVLGEITEPGMVVGTVHYMSPEQAFGRSVDGRSDQYSVAVMLYEALSGRLPLGTDSRDGPRVKSFLETLSTEQPAPLRRYLPEASPVLEAILGRALSKSADDRFPDARAFRAELARVASAVGPVEAPGAEEFAPTVRQPAPARAASREDGWSGERMPPGLRRGSEPPVYAWERNGVELELVHVPPGTYVLGLDEAWAEPDERPAHPHVASHGFWIARTQVTWRTFREFCRATGHPEPPPAPWGRPDDHPVVNVTWREANDCCAWLGLRLPSEVEWELAARGPDARPYPWGHERSAADRCVAREHPTYGDVSTAPVGLQKRGASPCGTLDACGNVREWCSDVYDPLLHRRLPGQPPGEPPRDALRSARGGAWCLALEVCRATYRSAYLPQTRSYLLGFRPALGGTNDQP